MRTADDLIDQRYLVRELLGHGGMAEVYRATDTHARTDVALKLLRDVEPGHAQRFCNELDVHCRLDHPGLVKLRDSGTHEGVPYLVLDLVSGPTLADELADGPLGLDRTLVAGHQVADALAHVHGLRVVHRDVKPSNILFDARGRAHLADFGIARAAGTPSLTHTGQLVGSAPYLAPEHVEGKETGPPADVYALGLVLVECLTGRRCYTGGQVEAALSRLHRAPDLPDDLPGWLRDVLTAMTARHPARRPTAAAVAESLRRRTAEPVLAATRPFDIPALHAPSPARTHGTHRAATRRLTTVAAAAAVTVASLLAWTAGHGATVDSRSSDGSDQGSIAAVAGTSDATVPDTVPAAPPPAPPEEPAAVERPAPTAADQTGGSGAPATGGGDGTPGPSANANPNATDSGRGNGRGKG